MGLKRSKLSHILVIWIQCHLTLSYSDICSYLFWPLIMKELEFVPPPNNILQRTRQVQSDPNKTSISHLTSIIYSWKKQKFCPQTLTTILKGDNPFCPGDSDSKKKSACSVGDLDSIPGLGRSPEEENGNQPQYSCLENPRDGGAWWAIVHEVKESQTWLRD